MEQDRTPDVKKRHSRGEDRLDRKKHCRQEVNKVLRTPYSVRSRHRISALIKESKEERKGKKKAMTGIAPGQSLNRGKGLG